MTYKPTGIIHVTGEPDSGKTLFALSAYHPKKTAYLFDDVKLPPIDASEFGLFVDLVGKYSNLKMLEFYQAFIQEVDAIPDNKYDAIIFDTWARIGKSIRYYAKAHPYEFREQSTFSSNGTIKNMEMWGETHSVEASVISKLSRKAKCLILVTHIKEKIIAGARSGLMEPDCGKSFDKVCNLRLWLRHNETSGVPIALVLKRISKPDITKDGLQITNVLPRRLYPQDSDTSVWTMIDRYWSSPIGNRKPEQFENPTEFELSILDGVLTKDQKEVWQAELREKQRQEKEEKELFNTEWQDTQAKVLELAKGLEGPPPIKAAQVLEQIGGEWTHKDIVEMIS